MDCSKRSAAAVARIHDDPLVDVLSRLPVKTLCRFKCVSKAWRDLITDPLHGKKLPQTLEGFFFFLCDSCGDDSGSDDRDGEFFLGDNLPRKVSVQFVDVLGRFVRPVAPHCFPFLTELPGIEYISLLHHCNGLLLFEFIEEMNKSLRYIVSNPATKQWVAVANSERKWSSLSIGTGAHTSLIFDPASSSHFHLVHIKDGVMPPVHIYSSKSGVWSHFECEWGNLSRVPFAQSAYVDGMLYVALSGGTGQIAAMDAEGNTRKVIHAPLRAGDRLRLLSHYVGQSQGRLHCIYHTDLEQFIWVLEDYHTQQWVLKDTVSFFHLFGKMSCQVGNKYNVVGIHPDHNLVFLVQHWDQKLISYNMDSKFVRHLRTLGHGHRHLTPYVPYFSELSALENKH